MHFCHLGGPFEVTLATWGSLLEHFGRLLEQLDGKKTGWGAKGAPGAPQSAQPRFALTFWGPFWESFSVIFQFFVENVVVKII
jgi:hypothetical protein